MNFSASQNRILWSRFLTHGGDQSWSFALPLALVNTLPGGIGSVALFYLIVRVVHMLLVTRVCGLMDRWDRLVTARIGIGAQTFGVMVSIIVLHLFPKFHPGAFLWSDAPMQVIGPFVLITIGGIAAALGATLMEVTVSQDWIPMVVGKQGLGKVNSRLKQIDLFTELTAPVVAGLLLTTFRSTDALPGIYIIAAWNFFSFIPEYRLLKSVYDREERHGGDAFRPPSPLPRHNFLDGIRKGWQEFLRQPAAGSMISYSLLWLTILSPHGVLLTGWLTANWNVSELAVGIFRGMGAIFGLLATVLFPVAIRYFSLVSATRLFILWEAFCLVGAGCAFALGQDAVMLFAALILLSRIGLYGFSLGETEIRQISIPAESKGRVNGFAQSLTSLATIGVYAAGTGVVNGRGFNVLVFASIGFVVLGAALFFWWSITGSASLKILSGPGSAIKNNFASE